MYRRPRIEIVTESAVGQMSDLCRVYAEGAAVAGGDVRIWQIAADGSLTNDGWAALKDADAIVVAPSLANHSLTRSMANFAVRGFANPFGPDRSGRLVTGLGEGEAMGRLADTALQAGMTWLSSDVTAAQTASGLRNTAAHLVTHIREISQLAEEHLLAA